MLKYCHTIDNANRKKEADKFVDMVLDLKEVNRTNIAQENRIREVLEKISNIMILKDEAHHIYNYEKKWKQILMCLHKSLESRYGKGFNMELDFSATPRNEKGTLFSWLIVDFTLKEAIEMNIVKRPLKGIVQNATEIKSTNVVDRYRAWIEAGIKRWQEYKIALAKLNKKPILFFQCPDNEQADQLKKYLDTLPQISGRVLLIHTDSSGNVTKSDIEEARKFAQTVDSDNNIYEVIISTMMLNEGWDVRNVNVIVGLRSYTSERNILPEQVVGRGLRKMFPDENASVKDFVNVLEVIGPPGLMHIIEELEKDENIKLGTANLGNINITTIFVDLKKKNFDIEIPILTPVIIVRKFKIDENLIEKIPPLSIKLENNTPKTTYEAIDLITDEVQAKRNWDLPVPQDVKSVIAYYTGRILNELKLSNMFADLYPIVKDYVQRKLFDHEVSLEDLRVLFQISEPEVEDRIINTFVENLKDLAFTEREASKFDRIMISETQPFVWTKKVYSANKCVNKCVFNCVPCDNDLELNFSKFLDDSHDVLAFTKLVPKIGFFMEYRDSNGNLRYYYPDFIIKMQDKYVIAETKGEVDIDVQFKDKRAKMWCEDAERVTGEKWIYIRVNQEDFYNYQFHNLNELIEFILKRAIP